MGTCNPPSCSPAPDRCMGGRHLEQRRQAEPATCAQHISGLPNTNSVAYPSYYLPACYQLTWHIQGIHKVPSTPTACSPAPLCGTGTNLSNPHQAAHLDWYMALQAELTRAAHHTANRGACHGCLQSKRSCTHTSYRSGITSTCTLRPHALSSGGLSQEDLMLHHATTTDIV